MRLPMDGQSSNTKLEARCNLGERGFSSFSSGQTVGDDPDMVAVLDLSVGEVENVTNDSADRRTYGVQDPKRSV